MPTRMLIDARHPEETRVTVVQGHRVEEFDYESTNKAQLKGNIYLAKITRVEPSLQAAFVDYGGNRHGFLAFSEIHPDYYQIPVEDREELLRLEAKAHASELDNGEDDGEAGDEAKEPDESDRPQDDGDEDTGQDGDDREDNDSSADEETLEEEEIGEELRRKRLRALKRRYKIQEVIKRRQILLIQVVKEERGSKGAALTTYLSLAGRYTVLMPNTTKGGGISRKIANVKDRKRLKNVLEVLKVPDNMGCIIRTAGMNRTQAEIKRDVDYLIRLWEGIRTMTLKSIAPSLIYEEGNLIKRAIRDLYDRSISEILIEGEAGYRLAKDFMTLLMPSHAKKVIHYTDKVPLFHRYQVESQLDEMFSPAVTMKSGGYIVINPTEALVAIDVNSGRSTREHDIEQTALKTNLEAADEVARQLRLRDMSGLIVVDFIDMENHSNIRKIERRMRDALKPDRARVQVSRISSLGLMEISRQRLRPNLVEASTVVCPHCEGVGRIRSTESSALHVLRGLEADAIKPGGNAVTIEMPTAIAIYILNQKRQTLHEMEDRYGLSIQVQPNDSLITPAYEITRAEGPEAEARSSEAVEPIRGVEPGPAPAEEERTGDKTEEKPADKAAAGQEEKAEHRRPRRRGRRGGRRRRGSYERGPAESESAAPSTSAASDESEAQKAADKKPEKAGPGKPAKAAAEAKTEDSPATGSAAIDSEAPGTGEAAKKPAARKRPAKSGPEKKAEAKDGPPAGAAEPSKPRSRKRGAGSGTRKRPVKKPEVKAKEVKAKKDKAKSVKPGKARAKAGPGKTASKPVSRSDAAPGSGSAGKAETEMKADKAMKADGAATADAAVKAGSTAEAKTPPAKKAPKKAGWWQRSG